MRGYFLNRKPDGDVLKAARNARVNASCVSYPASKAISVIVEKNPFPLAGRFEFLDGALPFVKLNVKIGESSDVRVVAEAGGKHFTATREIKVTIGGCGG